MLDRYIYISFSRKDHPQVQALIDTLKAMGFRIMYDDGSEAGTQWSSRLEAQLQSSNCVVVFLTENSLNAPSVMQELSFALSQGKQIVAVCLENVPLTPGLQMQLSKFTVIHKPADTQALAEQLISIDAVRACKEVFSTAASCVPAELPSVLYCSSCGYPNEPDAQFCRCCGQPLMTTAPLSKSPKKRLSPSEPVTSSARKLPLKSRIKRLFGGNVMTDVNFSVLVPGMAGKGSYIMVDIYAFEEAFRHIVEKAKAERTRHEGPIAENDGGHLQVRMGTRITVRLSSPDVEITDNEETRVWSGKYVKFDFPVTIPQDYQKDQLLFCAAVYFDGVLATRIRFVVSCRESSPQRPKLEQRDIHSAFISYASGDLDRVALILQGMRQSRPNLDVFFDVETLKTGERWEQVLRKEIDNRDILYLCWSKLAKESPWVEMEWRYALKNKGLDGIEPIPLVLPKDCPPPEELKSKHFGARELYYQWGQQK